MGPVPIKQPTKAPCPFRHARTEGEAGSLQGERELLPDPNLAGP